MGKTKVPTNRLYYIDAIETLSIFLVVFCHFTATLGTDVIANVSLQFSTVVAVPLFFMANGTLLFTKQFDLKKHLKKTGLLFMALILWRFAYLIAILISKKTLFTIGVIPLLQYLFGQNMLSPYVPSEHFWFLYELIGIYLVFPFVKLAYDANKKTILYLAILLFVAVPIFTEIATYSPAFNFNMLKTTVFPFSGTAGYLLMFILGPIIHENVDKSSRMKFISLFGAVISFLFLLIQKYIQTGTFVGQWIRLDNDYQRLGTYLLAGCIYIFFETLDYKSSKINKFISFVSMRTMNIYCAHMMLCYAYEVFVFPYVPYSNIFVHIVRTLLIILLAILISEPFTYIPGLRTVMAIKPAHTFRKLGGK